MDSYNIIGLMSGTSLDGIDLIYTHYEKKNDEHWEYALKAAKTYPFTEVYLNNLHAATELTGSQLMNLDYELGVYFSQCIREFMEEFAIPKTDVDAIASHGQTIFHQPSKGYSTQIANPAVIAVKTGITTIGDFRTKDVLYGGQGAPLVPIGDFYLFGDQADAFINLGGFANISFKKGTEIIAYDICPVNLPLNKLARNKGFNYDKNGELGRKGELNYFLLDLLNSLEYYQLPNPKSLGVEWLELHFYPLLKFDKDIENNMATVVEHVAIQLSETCNRNGIRKVMLTGGGAKNRFLIERFKRYFDGEICSVSDEIIEFKEALIFGLLGALRLNGEPNCLKSVTGALKNVSGGVIHLP